MLDLTGFAAREWYEAIHAEREYEAGRHRWLSRLRDLQRQDRAEARKATPPRPPSGPRKLTGAHTPWI
jgi:hypothetical protein